MHTWTWALTPGERMLTVEEVAAAVGLSRRAVYRAIERGDLRASRLASRLRVEPDALQDWIAATRTTGGRNDTIFQVLPRQPAVPVGGLRERLYAERDA